MNVALGDGIEWLITIFNADQLTSMLIDVDDIIADCSNCVRPCCKTAREAWTTVRVTVIAALDRYEVLGEPAPSPRGLAAVPSFRPNTDTPIGDSIA